MAEKTVDELIDVAKPVVEATAKEPASVVEGFPAYPKLNWDAAELDLPGDEGLTIPVLRVPTFDGGRSLRIKIQDVEGVDRVTAIKMVVAFSPNPYGGDGLIPRTRNRLSRATV